MKNNGDSFYKIIRFFLLSSLCTLAVVFVFSGFSWADINSNKMATGQEGTVLALAHNEQKLELQIDKEKAAAIKLPSHESLDFILGCSPVYWLCESIYELILNL